MHLLIFVFLWICDRHSSSSAHSTAWLSPAVVRTPLLKHVLRPPITSLRPQQRRGQLRSVSLQVAELDDTDDFEDEDDEGHLSDGIAPQLSESKWEKSAHRYRLRDGLVGAVRRSTMVGEAFFDGAIAPLMALCGLSARFLVSGLVFLALVMRRDAAVTVWVIGSLLNAVLGKVLKRLFNHSRPDEATVSDPGMPSSHAMSLSFLSVSLIRAIIDADRLPAWWRLDKRWAVVLVSSYALLSAVWRVRANLHTSEQVAVGGAVGGTVGLVWYQLGKNGINKWMERQFVLMTGKPLLPWGWLVGICLLGSLTVGSVERKIHKLLVRLTGGAVKRDDSSDRKDK
ncbi:unnamed protein product [Vitrella brassicaformis CCMP3155]|uniref:Phosphatidic acid phosphatase type 2/haloperoxidase domain-containing protein n=2 Tax=Vitrella brassicaformis TaxID=1169539 RepID=A0A0G4EJI9_VITBC|nr:unnamed protein product [Vitrella brassicaformis CCMP3155]|eukprot:CEL96694.1 unnamed protein product [Vitrella brassicaformis CCMP3155]